MRSRRSQWSTGALALAAWVALTPTARAQTDPLPSRNDGPARRAILSFVGTTTSDGSPDFVPAARRIATFDQDDRIFAFEEE